MEKFTAPLFGGAITCVLPVSFKDLSKYLPIPNHQEVYVQHVNQSNDLMVSHEADASQCVLSVEIIQYHRDKDNEAIGRYLFDDLAKCNEAQSAEIKSYRVLEQSVNIGTSKPATAISITGCMQVAKKRARTRPISAILYIIRLPQHESELLVSYNFPLDDPAINQQEQLDIFDQVAKTIFIQNRQLFTVCHE